MSKPTQKITEFDRASLRQITAEAEELLRPLAEKYGLVLDRKPGSYRRDALPVMLQFLVRVEDGEGNALTAKGSDFMKFANVYGMAPSDLGREFVSNGKRFRISGLNIKAQRTPIIADEVNSGRGYRFDVHTVKLLLGATSRAV